MLTYVWIILLAFRVDADHPELGPQWCYYNFCVQLSKDEISAEAGLCAVIHCSFNIPQTFTPSRLIWFKCGHKCDDRNSDIIYHSRGQNKVQSKFSGRVLPLESDLSQRNCSIIINNLQLSDSGTYYMRLVSANNGFSFYLKTASISVKALQQKPTVLSPALTEGLNASLTCTAPGLCSGSKPRFTWTWTGAGEAPPTVTTTTTEHLTSVNHRHSSTLELSPSAELHGAELSCTVSFNNSSTQDSLRINVTYVKDIEVSGDTAVKEGDSLNVTCSVDSFPPSRLMWFGPNRTSLNVSGYTETSSQTDLGSASLLIHNITPAQSGQYVCEGLHLDSSQTRDIHVSVIYLREPVLSGDTSVVEGSALSLNCTMDSFPPPSNITLRRGEIYMNFTQTDPGSVSLTISSVTLEDAGRYECTVEHELRTLSTSVDVFLKPLILNSSGCVVYDRDVLSCACVSRASPLPTVTWPLLQHLSEYTLVTTVTRHTVNSSLVLRASEHNRTKVQCVSSNRAGQVQEGFTPSIGSDTTEPPITPEKIIQVVSRLEVIVAFLAGFILAAVLCCVVIKCHRKQKKEKKDGDLNNTLEMVNGDEEPEINGHVVEVTDANTEPGELHYANINFSAMTQKARDRENREETKTEYAEIKREVIEEQPEPEEVQEENGRGPGGGHDGRHKTDGPSGGAGRRRRRSSLFQYEGNIGQ